MRWPLTEPHFNAILPDMKTTNIALSIKTVRAYRHAMGWSIVRLGTEAGIGESTLRRMDRDDWNPTSEILKRLEGIVPKDFDPDNPETAKKGKAA